LSKQLLNHCVEAAGFQMFDFRLFNDPLSLHAAIQHPPLRPRHRGRRPGQSSGVQHKMLVEIGVEVPKPDFAYS
jgi:hypothetical protein